MQYKCKDCKWWVCGGSFDGKPYDWGFCQLKPPTVFQKTKDISKSYDNYSTIVTDGTFTAYPKTNDTGFCVELTLEAKQ